MGFEEEEAASPNVVTVTIWCIHVALGMDLHRYQEALK